VWQVEEQFHAFFTPELVAGQRSVPLSPNKSPFLQALLLGVFIVVPRKDRDFN
jgi:hypothetical protein